MTLKIRYILEMCIGEIDLIRIVLYLNESFFFDLYSFCSIIMGVYIADILSA